VELTVCTTDEDYEAWRRVRVQVVPHERTDTVAEMRAADPPERLRLLARVDGEVVGAGAAGRSNIAGGGYVAPLVLAEHRRRGYGTLLLHALADHVAGLGVADLRAMTDDDESLAFALHFGFVEVDRQVEQVRAVGDEPEPGPLPEGVEVVTTDERPDLWAASYDRFGREALADFAVFQPIEVSADQWAEEWPGDPMFLAVHDGEVIGCAGLDRDTDRPERGENALTAVRSDWRGHGLAVHLKLRTLRWAADHGLTELYTWTQAGNRPMLTLNERLGYVTGLTSTTLSRPLPL
jgi:mycothiol synthase